MSAPGGHGFLFLKVPVEHLKVPVKHLKVPVKHLAFMLIMTGSVKIR